MVDNRYDLGWLVGRTLAEVNWTEQGSWQFGFGPAAGVRADCPWRVIRDETRDLVIRFASGTRLELVPLSSGYESWQLGGPGGSLVVAQGGGKLAIWHPLNAEPSAAERSR